MSLCGSLITLPFPHLSCPLNQLSPVYFILVCPDSGLSTSPHLHHCLPSPTQNHLSTTASLLVFLLSHLSQVSQWYLSDQVTLKALKGLHSPTPAFQAPCGSALARLLVVASLSHSGYLLPSVLFPLPGTLSLPLPWLVPSHQPRLSPHATSLGRPPIQRHPTATSTFSVLFPSFLKCWCCCLSVLIAGGAP